MKKNYDFSKAVRNPYAKRLKRQLTIRLDEETIGYFQDLSREMSLPYQTLMNMYLRDCAETRKRPHWAAPARPVRAHPRPETDRKRFMKLAGRRS
jgi:hypothetical protein